MGSNKEMQKDYKLIEQMLPSVEHIKIRSESDFYGVTSQLAGKFGLSFTPWSRAAWKHGWLFPKFEYCEQVTAHKRKEEILFLVAKKEHEAFLESKDIKAKAIGMPYAYVEQFDSKEVKRHSNSLLVMPPHSLPMLKTSWDEESYIEMISKLRAQFSIVVVCLYQSCVEQGLWIKTLERYDIPWILGARSDDKNALIRMHRIFQSFEYMTTNTIGSHVVYASYSGCKVSIYGPYAEYSKSDYSNDKTYKRFPFLLDHNLKYASEKSVRLYYGFLFCEPRSAAQHRQWAAQELGVENKVNLLRLVILLGWLPHIQLYIFFQKVYSKIKKLLSS